MHDIFFTIELLSKAITWLLVKLTPQIFDGNADLSRTSRAISRVTNNKILNKYYITKSNCSTCENFFWEARWPNG